MTTAPRIRLHRPLSAGGVCAAVIACLLIVGLASRAGAADLTLEQADGLASSPGSSQRDRSLDRWAKKAGLADIMYVLRHPPEALGRAEARLLKEAISRTSDARADLRRTLRLRLAVADPGQAKRVLGRVANNADRFGSHSRASAFRLAALLPEEGPYAAYSEAMASGLRAGLAYHNARTRLPIELNVWHTGDDRPARAAAALDSASRTSAVVVGELLSVPTLAMATGARMIGVPLISPTATDESIGSIGASVFQVGPSGYHRGVVLARAVLQGSAPRVAVLLSSDLEQNPFHRGFEAQVTQAGGEIIWRDTYAPGSLDFTNAVKRLSIEEVDLLLWEGDPLESAALLRELQRQSVRVRMCGSENLAPDNYHAASRALLEGVRYVADDWLLAPGMRAPMDSLLRAEGVGDINALHLRGFLTAHLIAAVVEGRALCREEITTSLATRVTGDAYLRERGFLDWTVEGASLPVYEVRSGQPVALR